MIKNTFNFQTLYIHYSASNIYVQFRNSRTITYKALCDKLAKHIRLMCKANAFSKRNCVKISSSKCIQRPYEIISQSEADLLANSIGDFKFTNIQKSTNVELNLRTFAGKLELVDKDFIQVIANQFNHAKLKSQEILKTKLIQMANISIMPISDVTDLI